MKFYFKKREKLILFLLCVFSAWILTSVLEAATDPVVVELHYQNGIKFYKRGLYDRAIQELEKTLALDPQHAEAKEYLGKIEALKNEKKTVEATMSKDAQLRELYEEGRRRYARGDYEAASEVFNKILEIKPIDDFASFYKERCEILIGRKLAREKKIENRETLKEQKIQERLYRKKAIEQKKLERQEMLKKRAEINEERLQAKQERAQQWLKEKTEVKTKEKEENVVKIQEGQEKQETPKESIKDQKKQAKEQKLAEQQEKIEAKKKLKEERRAAVEQRRADKVAQRQEALARKEEVRQAKLEAEKTRKVAQSVIKEEKILKKKNIKEGALQRKEALVHNKELYLQGVEDYAKKHYQEAIESLQAVLDAERSGEKIYSNAAQRLMDKVKMKLKATQK